jgi:hypothetical protein
MAKMPFKRHTINKTVFEKKGLLPAERTFANINQLVAPAISEP